MSRKGRALTARTVETLSTPGLYGDGKGLYLQVTEGGARSWVYRFQLRGKRRDMGLGPTDTVTLAEARDRAAAARKLVKDGADPIEARREARRKAVEEAARGMTFRDAAERYIAAHKAGWRNPKHAQQWPNTLEKYVYPFMGDQSVAKIDTALVTKVLEPIWTKKPETAGRVRGRIEAVLDWATARGYRQGENPARWRGHLQNLLAKRSKVRRVEHHAALPYADLPAFLGEVRAAEGMAARAMEFTILTCARTSEVINAVWGEIDLANKVWNVPGSRMKAGKDHRVPLSDRAVAILKALPGGKGGDYVFPGLFEGQPLSNMAMLALLRRMGRDGLTVHGFRSSFRDWAAEQTNFPHEVAELALAHAIADRVEAAYRRGDMFEKRRKLADAWASYCTKPPAKGGKVVPIGKARA